MPDDGADEEPMAAFGSSIVVPSASSQPCAINTVSMRNSGGLSVSLFWLPGVPASSVSE